MSDLFHHDVPDEFIAQVFGVMRQARWHIFQLLTKRSQRMRVWSYANFRSGGCPPNGEKVWPKNVWAGVSVETQAYIWRVRDLQQVPAEVRFLSIEPLLEPVALGGSLLDGIDWVIVGGESGPFARPMRPEWVRAIRQQCQRHGARFFFKQWGAYTPDGRRVGKKAAGRVLDGRTWDEMPMVLTAGEQRLEAFHVSPSSW
jgi:protein gp37